MDGNKVVLRPQCLLLGALVLLLPFIPGSKYLLSAKKLISNTAYYMQCLLIKYAKQTGRNN